MEDFKPDGKLQIIHQNGQPYGIRDDGGYLLFFSKVHKYPGQEDRYVREINEAYALADQIVKALTNRSEKPDSSKPKK